jgi:hypothetical protein
MMDDYFAEWWDDLLPQIEDSIASGEFEVEHTNECQQAQATREAERATYATLWPHYCRVCNGYGQVTDEFDPSPTGVGLSGRTMKSVDPCETCVECRVCPRCGMIGLGVDGEGPCSLCGFNFTDGLPLAFECFCAGPEPLGEDLGLLRQQAIGDIYFQVEF